MRNILLAAALAALSFGASAQMREVVEVPAGALDQADVDFLRTADTANIDQLTFAMRVTGRARTSVRSLAENVLGSHRKADDALRMLATAKNVELDHRMSPRAQSEADDLLRRDVDVDRMYVEDLARDSADMIALYEAARDTSRDPDIRQYAETMLPALRSNQRQAEDRLARAGLARE